MFGSGPFGAMPFGSVPQSFEGLPTILLQAIIVPGMKVPDGNLVKAVAPAWEIIVRLFRSDPNSMYEVPPRKWEELVAGAYEKAGFDRVTLTPASGDRGRDVIAEKDGWGSVRILDQVKAYKPGHLVTAQEVRALGFVLQADHGATKGLVTTTSGFAPRIAQDPLIAPFLPTRIELVDGTELLRRLSTLLGDAP